ncbi:MAG: MFS transporter [Woeseiaceae bacterium]
MSPPFTIYLVARVLLTLASSMLSVAVGWHIYEATGNPFDLALVGLVQILPIAGLFIVSGWVVDNLQRKYVLAACAALQALVLVGLALTLGGDSFERFLVFGLLFISGVGRAFNSPAMQSVLPNIVSDDELPQAVAITNTAWTGADTAGPFIAGLLIAWIDTGIYAILATFCVVAGVLLLWLPATTVRRPTGRMLSQLLDGVRYVYRNPLVLPSISLDLVLILVSSVIALLPVYAIDVLNVGPEALGLMRAMPALGAVSAGVLLTRLPAMRRTGTLLYGSLAIFAVSVIVFGLSSTLWLSLVALFVYGASDMVSVNVRTTVIQLATPDELRGRVNSVNSLFIATSNDMGSFRAGAVAAVLGPVATVLTGGVMAVAVVIGGYFLFPTLRRLDRITDSKARGSIPTTKSSTLTKVGDRY